MAANWNLYFAGYQKTHGGAYFGSDRERYDCQLVLTEQEKAPILVYVDTEPAGRSYTLNIVARTSVRLNGEYHLKLGGANAVVGGVKGLAGKLGGGNDYGCPDVTRSRSVTTNNKPFTKQVLGDLDFRNALMAQKKVYVEIRPTPQGEGWHMVEIGRVNFDGIMTDGEEWVSAIMARDTGCMTPEEKTVIEQAAQADFDRKMDEFLTLLRAAACAVTTWRM